MATATVEHPPEQGRPREQPQTVIPNGPVLAKMHLYPMDAVVPAGHSLVLRLVPDASIEPCASVSGEDTIQRPKIPGPDALPLRVHLGPDSRVVLPVIQREVEESYPGQPE